MHRSILLFLAFVAFPFTAAAEYAVEPVTGGGVIKGTVAFSGSPPAVKAWSVNKEKEVCADGDVQGPTIRVADGKVPGAVVYLTKVTKGKDWDVAALTRSVDQKGCRFLTEGVVVRANQPIEFVNSDTVLHNVHGYELIGPRGRRSLFNIGQASGQPALKLTPKMKRSNTMKIECDAHNFMHKWFFAASNPYFAVTAEDGSFEIDEIPPGTYELAVWHPALPNPKTKPLSITVDAKQTVEQGLKLE